MAPRKPVPELPEVETVVRGLRATLAGRRILSVRLGKTDFIDKPQRLVRELPGSRIVGVERYGKFLALRLQPKQIADVSALLLIHLGMTGQLVLRARGAPVAPHTHIFFRLEGGRELRYTDIRRFGRVTLVSSARGPSVLSRLGRDALEISLREFRQSVMARRARIKALLLDQAFLRGLGNIYVDESLWHARIHPARPASSLAPAQVTRLYESIRRVLHEAIRLRGSSVSDYVDSAGLAGAYQQRHRVYRRDGGECFRCVGTIRRTVVAGRGSYFCPRCQPAPARSSSTRAPAGPARAASLSEPKRSGPPGVTEAGEPPRQRSTHPRRGGRAGQATSPGRESG